MVNYKYVALTAKTMLNYTHSSIQYSIHLFNHGEIYNIHYLNQYKVFVQKENTKRKVDKES